MSRLARLRRTSGRAAGRMPERAAAPVALSVAFAVLLAAMPGTAFAQRLLSVPKVDLQRYAGTWYEIARLPNRYQTECVSDVTAAYALRDDGAIAVTNRCRSAEGEDRWQVAEGLARPIDGSGAKLEVSFLPEWLRWLPFGWGSYWVLELDEGYRHALVGEPTRRNLWLLSRTPALPAEQVQEILGRAREMGFAVGDVILTRHTAESR